MATSLSSDVDRISSNFLFANMIVKVCSKRELVQLIIIPVLNKCQPSTYDNQLIPQLLE